MADIPALARAVITELIRTGHVEDSESGGALPPIVQRDSPPCRLMTDLQAVYPDRHLPAAGRILWKRFLAASRGRRPDVYDRADALVAWLEAQAEAADPENRPASPTREYCCVSPNVIRWNGEASVPPTLWHFIGYLLANDRAIEIGELEQHVYGKEVKPKTISNDLAEINDALERVGLQEWRYGLKAGNVVRKIF